MLRLLLLVLGLGLVPIEAGLRAEQASEYQLKAAFVCGLPRFTTWPSGAFLDATDPLRIAVVGQDPFGSILENVSAAQTFEGRRTEIVRVPDLDHLPLCQVLFVAGNAPLTADARRKLALPGVITIGESPNFATSGGIVRLYVDGQKVKLEINTRAAQRNGLRFDAQLLSLAKLARDAAEDRP